VNYSDAGMLGIYAGCLPNRVDDVVAICRAQLAAMAEHGATETEVERGKGQLKGSSVLGLEDSGSRMSRIAKAELLHGEHIGLGELLRRIDAVTRDDVCALATELLTAPPALAVVGPFDGADRFADALR
ncbi:MAG: insulinase family protein, partial [Actinomycetota bacterium]|nr:insulinase family protein [Actinomycetota bacterium]